ncbi:MAG: hypothetical protein MK089_08450 [Phycisphaerales bacterium]|nr:hypothetical protein [Phycisphaerales bacterium]
MHQLWIDDLRPDEKEIVLVHEAMSVPAYLVNESQMKAMVGTATSRYADQDKDDHCRHERQGNQEDPIPVSQKLHLMGILPHEGSEA